MKNVHTAEAGVASVLRAELARRRLKQRDLARALGISEATASSRLNGGSAWRVDELLAACAFLGVDASIVLAAAAGDRGDP